MIATAQVTVDRAYYEAYFDGWIRTRAGVRRWLLPLLAVATTVLGGMILTTDYLGAGALLLVFGLWGVIDAATTRRRWIAKMLKEGRSPSFRVEFDEDEIRVISAEWSAVYSYQFFRWNFSEQSGIYLAWQKGHYSVFVPRSSIAPEEAVAAIMEKLSLSKITSTS